MVVSAQWELVLGNSYGYTVLSAFGLFYGGFGAIITPFFGVKESYGDDIAGYNNALGFWVLSKLHTQGFCFLPARSPADVLLPSTVANLR
jgi:succinate-acetate transporter protein